MKVICIVEWTGRDRLEAPIAGVRPLVELQKDNWRVISSEEEFPTNGLIFWSNAIGAVEDSIIYCRTEPNHDPKYAAKVVDPKHAFEVLDLRHHGDAHRVRTALIEGISLPGPIVTIATKNQPFSQGGWKGVAELVVGFERKLGCLFLSIVPTRLPIFHEGFRDTLARSSARFHGCRS